MKNEKMNNEDVPTSMQMPTDNGVHIFGYCIHKVCELSTIICIKNYHSDFA